ncbi:MAG: DUF4393 domain-containing protein [Geminicoccaceae bacterium]|nr:MAG: DUF4393 domain-containing protein [Geminicoccaceae bacterium]
MTSDSAEDRVTATAKEFVKQFPIKDFYEDGLSPSVKEVGGALADITKTLRLVLAPIQFTGLLQDRFRDFLETSITRVPREDRVPPPAQVLGPVLEGIRYEPEGTPIDQMFSELLSRSMDEKRANEAHPSYAHLIKQISADEARILRLLSEVQYDFVYTSDFDQATRTFQGGTIEKDELPKADLDFPENVSFYMDHLHSLGLAGIYQQGNQEMIMAEGQQTGVRVRCKYLLSDLGQRFVTACTSKSV